MRGDGFFCMMDQRNSRTRLTLQNTEEAEQFGDLTGRVFIDRMKADQGIEDEKNGAVKPERGLETLLIGDAIQTQRIGTDDADIEIGQLEPVVLSQRFQA